MANRQTLESALKNPNVRKFLDLIAYTEGTQGNGYHTAFGGGRLPSIKDHPRYSKPFTQQNGQRKFTSAAGRYQFLKGTWDNVARQYGLSDFGPHNQDLGAVALLIGRGALAPLLKGDWQTAVRKSGPEWASLPTAPASYSQPTKSWSKVNKFWTGQSGSPNTGNNAQGQSYQQQPQADPRLSMSAPQLLATLKKRGGANDIQMLYELANNNGLAGREIKTLMAQGNPLDDIARQLGLSVPSREPQAAPEPEPFPSFEEFMQGSAEPELEPFPSFEEFTANSSENQGAFMPDSEQPQAMPQEQPSQLNSAMGALGNPEMINNPYPVGDTWQTQNRLSDSMSNSSSARAPQMQKSSWESLN